MFEGFGESPFFWFVQRAVLAVLSLSSILDAIVVVVVVVVGFVVVVIVLVDVDDDVVVVLVVIVLVVVAVLAVVAVVEGLSGLGCANRVIQTPSRHWRAYLAAGAPAALVVAGRGFRAVAVPMIGQKLGLPLDSTLRTMMLATVVELPCFLPLSWVAGKFGRRTVFAPAVGLVALCWAALSRARSASSFRLAACALGFASGMTSGFVTLIGQDYAPGDDLPAYFAPWETLMRAAQMAGPVFAHMLATRCSPEVASISASAATAAAACWYGVLGPSTE